MSFASPSELPASRKRWIFVAWGCVFLVILLLVIPIKIDLHGRLLMAVWNGLHAPVMLIAALAALYLLRPRFSVPIVVVGLLVLIVLFEVLQPLWGRSCDMWDIVASSTGVFVAVALTEVRHMALPARLVWRLLAGLWLILSLVPMAVVVWDRCEAHATFPLLARFETDRELARWECSGCRLTRSSQHVTEGRSSGRVQVEAEEKDYSGLFLTDVRFDWSRGRGIRCDVFLAGTEGRELWVRVDDRVKSPSYADRFQKSLALLPGSNIISIVREEMVRTPSGRYLDLKNITRFGLFFAHAEAGCEVFIDDVRLILEDEE